LPIVVVIIAANLTSGDMLDVALPALAHPLERRRLREVFG
jgi:hypothetical protein